MPFDDFPVNVVQSMVFLSVQKCVKLKYPRGVIECIHLEKKEKHVEKEMSLKAWETVCL